MKLTTFLMCACSCVLLAQSYYVKGPANPKPHEVTAMQELIGKTFEIWVSAKFTGKQFHPEQTDAHEYIYIDRVALVVPKE